jgi:hypothetical protein
VSCQDGYAVGVRPGPCISRTVDASYD